MRFDTSKYEFELETEINNPLIFSIFFRFLEKIKTLNSELNENLEVCNEDCFNFLKEILQKNLNY
jgi:hypothetical protein